MEFDVFFDYTCGYAYRAHRWLGSIGLDGRWRTFSLLEANQDDDGPPVWDQERHRDNISLLLLAGHHVVRESGGDIAAYRGEAFHAWHETDDRLDAGDVIEFAARAAVDADASDLHDAFDRVADEHRSATGRGVFGSPTMVFDDDESVFVRLAEVPSADAATEVFETVREVSKSSHLLELKRPVAPRRGNRRNLLTGAG